MRSVTLTLILMVSGCAPRRAQPEIPLTPPRTICEDSSLGEKAHCVPKRAEELLRTGTFEVLQVQKPSSGLGGALIFFLRYPDDNLVIKAKWKASAKGGHGFNNQPRKELAAYKLQSFFLEQDEFVVPPTVGRCIDSDTFRSKVGPPKETFPGAPCVYGLLAYWLTNVTTDEVLDPARFESDPAYRQTVANLNLLTYLVDHRDTRRSNFLVSTDRDRPHAYAVDNGLAFSGFRNPLAYMTKMDWSEIIVPALPRAKIDRLRRIAPGDLDTLLVVSQYRVTPKGLDEVKPAPAFSVDQGVRREGDMIQLGLTRNEVGAVAARLDKLFERIDRGDIRLF